MNPYDAFIFGACVGFIAVFPVAILLHFIAKALSYEDEKNHDEQYP